MRGGMLASRRQGLALLLVASAVTLLSAPATAGQPGSLHVDATGKNAELLKTIPIGRHRGAKPKAVLSLSPAKVGTLQSGDRLEASAEQEVSVCLHHNSNDPGSGYPCVGKDYAYSPKVEGQIVVGPNDDTTGPANAVAIGKPHTWKCSQQQPNRNHHCVLVIPKESLEIPNVNPLPCGPSACHVNLVLNAWNRNAKKGQQLVIGANDGTSKSSVNGNRGKVSIMRFRPGTFERPQPRVFTDRAVRSIPIVRDGGDTDDKVIYSIPMHNLHAGDQFIVDAKAKVKIGGVPYNVFLRNEAFLATGPNETHAGGTGNYTGKASEISPGNGFNCTQGKSDWSNPCPVRKPGVLHITKDPTQTFYINVLSGAEAKIVDEHYHHGDRAKISGDGQVKIWEFPAP
jgi:hypothetical protein